MGDKEGEWGPSELLCDSSQPCCMLTAVLGDLLRLRLFM